MRRTTQKTYRLYVDRDGTMIEYSATDFPSVEDARAAARRRGEYVEIRSVEIVRTVRLVERVEVEAA